MTGTSEGGVSWVAGVAGATRYPTDGQGAGSATNTLSELIGTGAVMIVGVMVSTGAAVDPAVELVDHAGTTIPGLSAGSTAAGGPFGFIGIPAEWRGIAGAGGANVGIKCGAGVTATLFYKRQG